MTGDSIDPPAVDAVVVGAGFAGLYAAYSLHERGFTFQVFEAGTDVGGTWYWNRYPGARCDVESVDYTMSFSDELHAEWTWSERFAAQPEILRYAEFIADRLELRQHITFNSQVTAMVWDETDSVWQVTLKDGTHVRTRFVITAVGLLSASNAPKIPGLDSFAGRTLQTSHWPHEGADFSGRRVAVIGTGSSGIQVIPEIAPAAAEFTVFQRTANFSIPAHNRLLTARERYRWRTSELPFIRENAKTQFAGSFSESGTKSILEVSDEERDAELERSWSRGGTPFLSTYPDSNINLEANAVLAEWMRGKIRSIVTDPVTAAKLEPHSHPVGAKRPTLNSDYYETFNLPHVHLVDLNSEPIVEITPDSIKTTANEYPIDDLVLATGFDAVSGPYLRMGIRGLGGISLSDEWVEGSQTYLGLAIAGFPNLFTITGPMSATPLTNVIRSIEQHVEWISDCLDYLRAHEMTQIVANRDAQEEWDRRVDKMGDYTLHKSTSSWYTGGNIEGKPRKLMAYVGGLHTYRKICQEVVDAGYAGFELTGHGKETVDVSTP